MSTGKNRRRGRSENQAKERHLEQVVKLEALIAIFVKDKVETHVHESKQQLEANTERLLERVTTIRNSIEQIKADTLVIELIALNQSIESEAEKLQEKFDKLTFLPNAMTLDKHLKMDEGIGNSKEIDMLSEEIEMFSTQVENDLDYIISKILQFMIEQNRQNLDSYLNQFIGCIAGRKLLAKRVKADEKLVNDIDNFQQYIISFQRDFLEEVAEIQHLTEEPVVNNAIIHDEYRQILSKQRSFLKKSLNEFNSVSDELKLLIETRARRRRLSAFVKVSILNLMIYLQWSLPTGLFLLKWNGLLAFIITGLILIIINVLMTLKLSIIYEKYNYIFTITQFNLINFFIAFCVKTTISLSLILLFFIFSLHYLYLFLYFLFDFLTQTNLFLTGITNAAGIATIVSLLIGLLKQLNLLKYIKNLISLSSNK